MAGSMEWRVEKTDFKTQTQSGYQATGNIAKH